MILYIYDYALLRVSENVIQRNFPLPVKRTDFFFKIKRVLILHPTPY